MRPLALGDSHTHDQDPPCGHRSRRRGSATWTTPRQLVPMAPPFASPEIPKGEILSFLNIGSLRPLSACGYITSWKKLLPCLPGTLQRFLGSCRTRFQAYRDCLVPRSGWTEQRPDCSSPLCSAQTGLWLPTIERWKITLRSEIVSNLHVATPSGARRVVAATCWINRRHTWRVVLTAARP